MAKGGILEHEFAPGAAKKVGGDFEWLRGGRKGHKPGPEAAGQAELARGDRSDCHGRGSTTNEVAGPGR